MENEIDQRSSYPEQEGNFFRELLAKYISWWPLFAVMIILSLAGAWVFLRYSTPIYEATATIMVKDKDNDAELLESINVFGSKKNVENEVHILTSRNLAREVAVILRLYAPITQQNRIRATSAYLSSPIVIEAKDPFLIKPVSKVEFAYNGVDKTVKIGKDIYPMLEWNSTPFGTLRFLPNKNHQPATDPQPEEKKPFFFSLMPVKSAGGIVLGGLNVGSFNKQSSVITLTYKDAEPKRAEDILNELVNVYSIASIKDKSRLASNTMEFIDERLKFVVKELDSVEQNLTSYKKLNNIVDISSQGQLFLQNVGASDLKAEEIKTQIAVLNSVESYVLKKGKETGSIVPSMFNISDPVLTQLLDNLYKLEMEYDRGKQTMGANFPAMVAMADQIAKIKPDILENIQNQKRNFETGLASVSGSSNQYNAFLKQLPQREKELLNISRQQSIKNSIYTYLLEKREETALSYSSTVSDSRLVDTGEASGYPISPKKNAVWMTALILALALSIGFVEVRGMLNRTVMSRAEIEKNTRLPIIGEIVYQKNDSSIVISEGVRSLVAEQFRQLRTSLSYLGLNGANKRKMLVTSSVPGEGKSFVCANLGISLALVGKKVVLIELDIRKPRLSKLFGMNQEVGITNYFIGERKTDEIIRPLSVSPNLHLISCGPLPPNPSELIVNGKLEELLLDLESRLKFDYIIIDTSPVAPVTDAYLISPLCDATIYVMRYGITPKVYLQKLDTHNRIKTLKNPAIVFNGVKSSGLGNYTYGYTYGYGYIDEEKKKKKKTRFKKEDAQN